MFRQLILHVLLIFACCGAASQPATAPTSAPATESLQNGAITFTPPGGEWSFAGKSKDDKTIAYTMGHNAAMAVNVTPQDSALDDSAADKMGPFIIKQTRDNVAKSGGQVIDAPRNEKDERFFLHIHDKFKNKDGHTADRLQVYRVIGRNLVTVAATSFSDSPEDAKKVHEVAEQVALSASGAVGASKIKSAKPPAVKPKVATTKPSMLPNAKLRVAPPAGWTEELTDASNGVVATYRDPQESGNLIAITVRPLPKEAAKDPKLRDALVDEIVSGEKQQFKIDGANASGQPETVKDNRFLRKTRTRYEGNGKRFTVTSRQLRIGDEVVSVSSIAVDETASAVETLADDVAVAARAMGR